MSSNTLLFVTAFKDIGRTIWSNYTRSTEKYINDFGDLLKHNNNDFNLICFCEDDIALILKQKYNFTNVYPYDPDNTYYKYLKKETEIMNSDQFKKLTSHRRENPECCKPEYNIVNHNKVIFINRAKNIFPENTHYAWIDFGYMQKNTKRYIKKFDLSKLKEKIVYSSMYLPDIETIPDVVTNCRLAPEIIQGSMFTIPNNLVEWYVETYTKTIDYFQSLNIVDDDQAIVLYVYKSNPQNFNLYITKEWFNLIYTLE